MDTITNLMKSMVYVILLCLYLKTHICLAADTITTNQSLSGDQTIVSAGGVFELGFFNPGSSSKYYIGIWYKDLDVVWVANREQPITDTSSSELRISDGNLVLFNESKSPIWSTNVSSTSGTSIRAVLLDNGNLVLRAGSNSSQPSWQSFYHPSGTLLPGGRIGFSSITKQKQILTSWKSSEDAAPGLYSLELDRNGTNSYILLWNRSKQYWTSGPWDEKNRTFGLVTDYIYNFSYVTNKNESYFTYSLYDPAILSTFLMHASGRVRQKSWLRSVNQWQFFWSQPRQCQVYAFCGAFGSCDEKSSPFCNCLNGFEPKSKVDWDLQDYSGGCSRRTYLYSGNATSDNAEKDRFLDMPSMSLPENQESVDAASIVQCESICLNNQSCAAYAYDSNGCSIWIGDLFNLEQLTGDDSDGTTLYLRLAASEFKNVKSAKSPAKKRSLVIATITATAGLLTVIVGCILWKKTLGKRRERRRKYNETKSNIGAKNDAELPVYSLKSILVATNNFSETNKLGEGGFGPVYKGILTESQEVAIKRLSKKSGQGHQEFMNELKLIAKLQHTNLVRLLGCCIEDGEMILIYEYMPNRSLDKFLFDASENMKLDWDKRFQIIEGVAQGVLYIHKYSRLKIIHRDLKTSNVLLDDTMKPRISDFGMARIFGINQTEANTNRVVGTYGYMSPEYGLYGQFSEKSDVFSYGVLLLEIVSGKRSGSFYHVERAVTLAGWAWELWKEGKGMEVIDASIRETCRPHEALRCIHVGFLCLQQSPADRPTMSSVIHMLQASDATSLPPSKEPAFSTDIRNSSARGSSSETCTRFSNNEVTISLPEAR
ncbi:receptor-like serine/threonine-protein kinase SD1-8 isoform X2 [Rosa chinensis]|uniref:receptor-like serine/threonine-protein kinase SD1-8 isoform X2 n=1 Tax=Rosa chinensis TaxID=74649 RepID=UPI001AD8F417|nr:receptor-like serine/threonine-protein kinase SD1-8 isoform X2 [Rosa chinensis]